MSPLRTLPLITGVTAGLFVAARLDKELAALRGIETGDLAAFNRMLRELNVPAVGVGGDRR
jgi:hypothetical protein